jgi:uncharacterized phage-associated protein
MASVYKVAEYILSKTGSMPAMKLQKLVYYSQAWSLVWDRSPLFDEPIEAWANGPVVRNLYAAHRQEPFIDPGRFLGFGTVGVPMTESQKRTVDRVIEFYGDKPSQWLSDLTHREDPWKHARRDAGLADGERGQVKISRAAMAEYYSTLWERSQALRCGQVTLSSITD